MEAKEVILRRYENDEYKYSYLRSPFEIFTTKETIDQNSGVYTLQTKIPVSHYDRPILMMFKATSDCVSGQKITLEDSNGDKTPEIEIVAGNDKSLLSNDISNGDDLIIYADIPNSVMRLININGEEPNGISFKNNYGMSSFPASKNDGDMLWDTQYSEDSNTYEFSEISVLNDGIKIVQYPTSPRQVYYATSVTHSIKKYMVTLGEFPLSKRTNAREKLGIMFMAKVTSNSSWDDTITIDNVDYGYIKIGSGSNYRNLFSEEISSGQTCTFSITENGVFLLFIDGKAVTSGSGTTVLDSTEPENPVNGDEWLQIVEVI